jgi:hypothetical protein
MNATQIKIATLSITGYKAAEQTSAAIRAAYPNADKARADKGLLEAYADKYGVPKAARRDDSEGNFAGFVGTRKAGAPKSERMDVRAATCARQFARNISLAFAGKGTKKEDNNKFDALGAAKRFAATHTPSQVRRMIDALKATLA